MRAFDRCVESLMVEATDVHTVGVFPGAFKPPHRGHYLTAKKACEECDEVYILVSSKSRDLNTQNIAVKSDPNDPDDPMNKTCDSARYRDFNDKPKYTSNLWSREIRPCVRAGSASAMRAAIGAKDVETMLKEIPVEVDREQVIDIYNMSNDMKFHPDNYGRVTVEQSLMVWRLFVNALIDTTGIDSGNVHVKQIKGSPVTHTYDLVSNINDSERASGTKVNLYVGS